MGTGQSYLYKGTYGDTPENIPDALKEKIKFPDNDAQLKHIFRKARGHLEDTRKTASFFRILPMMQDTMQARIRMEMTGISKRLKMDPRYGHPAGTASYRRED